jgi:hypothetical protein
MSLEFIAKEIAVTVEGVVKSPVSFRLGESEYRIAEIIDWWADHSFGGDPGRRRRWWQRHHRNYFRVRTTEGEVFELYYDRGANLKHPERKKWFLYRRL